MYALPSHAFGPLETAILGVLGACPRPLTVREIHTGLHDPALTYPTIMTTLARLAKEQMVFRAPTAARYAAAYRSMAPIVRLASAPHVEESR